MALDRRRFLQLSALSVVSSFADVACDRGEHSLASAPDRPQLLSVLGPDRVREIGSHYRGATPGENTADALRAAISKSRGFHIPLLGNESLDDQIEDDFEEGRTVVVDGWVLSVTEARQAALFSLTPA
jgi:hypothetical protein